MLLLYLEALKKAIALNISVLLFIKLSNLSILLRFQQYNVACPVGFQRKRGIDKENI